MKSKKGISLIVLIITIIVVIILAAVVILTLSKNNPIESAKEATFKEDVRTFQNELAMYISKDYINKAGARDEKITATNYNPAGDPASVYTYIASFSKKYENKFVIKNDELMYSEGKLTDNEQKWSEELNVKANEKTWAEKVKEDPATYYGAKVTNYIANGISDWRIFYSDGNNVYLIKTEYLDVDKLPSKDGVKLLNSSSSFPKAAAFFDPVKGFDITTKYNGSADIIDERIKKLNYDYFITNNFTSTESNMKAVSYMLDIEIWNSFVDSSVAEYAIGGPTIEMLLKSYSEKYNLNYRAKAIDSVGYLVNKYDDDNWTFYYDKMLNITDELYVLPQKYGADAMWISSPGKKGQSALVGVGYKSNNCNVVFVYYDGHVDAASETNSSFGFRPLVCLNSNILLNKVEGGYEISQ